MSFTVLGKTIPFYGLFLYIGIFFAFVIGIFLCRKRRFPFWDLVGAGAYAMIGGMIGSKLLFLAVSWKQILAMRLPFEAIVKGGFVFYGGLIGGFLGVLIYAKQFKMPLVDFLDLFAVPLPLAHAFGRIGCFFGGCCYGIHYNGRWSTAYRTSSNINTPLNTPLFPIQIISAIGLFLLFVVLFAVFLRTRKKGLVTCIYVIAYPILRFLAEFLRGDVERGIFGGLSVAQWVSLLIIVFFGVYFIRRQRHSR